MSKRLGADPFLLVLLMVSLGLNVYLGVRLVRPEARAMAAVPPPVLDEGAVVPAIKGTVDGKPHTLDYRTDRRPTVLYVFAGTCSWCERNAANLTQLIREREKDYRFVGLDLSRAPSTPESASTLGTGGLLVIRDLDGATRRAYRLDSTPQTIILSPEGKVLKHWRGAYAAAVKFEVEQFFGISLPGVSE